jgi:hypothetical protein
MASYSFLKNLLVGTFGKTKNDKNNDQIQVNCPHCAKLYNNYEPDNKYNLEINLQKRVYKCWKCEISGPVVKLLKYYSTKDVYNIYLENFDEIDFKFQVDESEDEIYKQVILPKEFIPISEIDKDLPSHLEAYNYLKYTRKISDKIISDLNIGFCDEGYYKNRIIIPSYDKFGKLNYFIARSYVNDKIPYIKPKISQDIIFNENRLDWNSTVYVVEGAFDYISIPINTLCLLGKTFIPYVFEKVIKYKPPMVFILDPDAIKQTIKYISLFKNMSINEIKFVELPQDSDIDELRVKLGDANLSKYILENSKELTDYDIVKYQ